MHRTQITSTTCLSLLGLLAACSSGSGPTGVQSGPTQVDVTTESLLGLVLDEDGIVDLDGTVDPVFTDVFARYTAIEVPGAAGRIHLLAQAGVDDATLTRTREILRLALTDVPGSARGADKADVRQAMIANGATLAVFESSATFDPSDPAVAALVSALGRSGSYLTADEVAREGTARYLATLPGLDCTFGSAAALVLRSGIEVARPTYAAALADHAANALSAGTFTAPSGTAPSELPSIYLALAADVHAGVFGHDPSGDGVARAHGASFAAIDRAGLVAVDPALATWLEDFFPVHHDFTATLPESFSGNFDCLRRTSTPYSARSQYLRIVELTGTNAAEIFGAPEDVTLIGNDGNNNLKGRRGFDTIIGGGGFDTAVFNGPRADYDVRFENGHWVVEDVFGGHEQTDILIEIERIQFADMGWNL